MQRRVCGAQAGQTGQRHARRSEPRSVGSQARPDRRCCSVSFHTLPQNTCVYAHQHLQTTQQQDATPSCPLSLHSFPLCAPSPGKNKEKPFRSLCSSHTGTNSPQEKLSPPAVLWEQCLGSPTAPDLGPDLGRSEEPASLLQGAWRGRRVTHVPPDANRLRHRPMCRCPTQETPAGPRCGCRREKVRTKRQPRHCMMPAGTGVRARVPQRRQYPGPRLQASADSHRDRKRCPHAQGPGMCSRGTDLR